MFESCIFRGKVCGCGATWEYGDASFQCGLAVDSAHGTSPSVVDTGTLSVCHVEAAWGRRPMGTPVLCFSAQIGR